MEDFSGLLQKTQLERKTFTHSKEFSKGAGHAAQFIEKISDSPHIESHVLLSDSGDSPHYIFFYLAGHHLDESRLNYWQSELKYCSLCKGKSPSSLGVFFSLVRIGESTEFIESCYSKLKEKLLNCVSLIRNSILPSKIQHENIKSMISEAIKTLDVLKIAKYSQSSGANKYNINFAITNLGLTTEDKWKTFPIYIEITGTFVLLRVFFSYETQYHKFSAGVIEQYLLQYIARANAKLSLGCFSLITSKQFVHYISSFPYFFLPKEHWQETLIHYLKLAIATYKSHAVAFARILEGHREAQLVDLQYLLKVSDGRLQGQNKLPAREIGFREREVHSSGSNAEESSESFQTESDSATSSESDYFEKMQPLLAQIQSDPALLKHFDMENLEINAADKKLTYTDQDFSMVSAVQRGSFEQMHLGAIIQVLLELYQAHFTFAVYPLDNVIYNPPSILLKPTNLFQLYECTTDSEAQYKRRMIIGQLEGLLDLQNQRSCGISSTDIISTTDFKHCVIDNPNLVIGNGGFGLVYKNELRGLKVAIKLPKDEKESAERGKKRIIQEYYIMRELNHPGILRTMGLVTVGGKIGLIMELCEQESLNEYVKAQRKCKSFRQNEALDYLLQVARALEFMHLRRICHFDVKPHNIFLNAQKQALLGDFGLSRYLDDLIGQKNTGYTLMYCSPEQCKGENLSLASDVWSFGMTMYSVLLGKSPYSYLERKNEKLDKNRYFEEVAHQKRKPEIPSEYEIKHPKIVHLLRSTWASEPEHRSNMTAIRRTLTKIVKDL